MNSQSASSLPSLTLQLSTLVGALCFEHLPKPVIHWASRAIADTIACALAGTNEDSPAMLASILPRTEGQSLVLGGRERMHMLDAAQRNGAAAHTLDFDDCNLVMDGHPSVSIIPALLALADELDCSGSAFLTAYVAGIEAEIRIAALSNPAHVDRGWHPTVTFGVLGCAIACARLLQLEPQAIARAIAIAASSAAGLRANSGTMTKPLHAAMANRNGLQAAL
ncbi:MAG TPA: MmgE/PrpD family protein, partial [Devosia sp.]|nr:MmgE/PrpD family protein [Devosia sp.]